MMSCKNRKGGFFSNFSVSGGFFTYFPSSSCVFFITAGLTSVIILIFTFTLHKVQLGVFLLTTFDSLTQKPNYHASQRCDEESSRQSLRDIFVESTVAIGNSAHVGDGSLTNGNNPLPFSR